MEQAANALDWGVVLILLPLAGALLAFLFRRAATIIGIGVALATSISAAGLTRSVIMEGSLHHSVGGWGAPLGIDLRADGLSVLMLLMAAAVGLAISFYAPAYFRDEPRKTEQFWPLWLFLWTGLNALFLSADIFNLYVTLELLGLAAVALTALSGRADALTGAMRYLLATLLGSLLYLFGVALLYHGFGSVDIATLAERVEASPVVWGALGLMAAGLLLKTALFPLHFWLPPAHASAPAPVSALLSALVVKASFYILLRLWLEIFGPLVGDGVGELLGLLGAAAVLWGSLQALRQTRLKLLIAYSTVAQLGYMFLVFPLAPASGFSAWSAAVYLVLSHALAKAAMFLAAGNLLRFGGHDRIADLDRVVQRLPLTVGAFALAGVNSMGLPPSGGFVGKWMLLEAALAQGRWDLVAVMFFGGLLAAAYIFPVLGYAFTHATVLHESRAVPAIMEWSALLLAIGAIMLGFLASPVLVLLGVGDAFGVSKVMP